MDMTNIVIGRGNKAMTEKEIAERFARIEIIDYSEFEAGRCNDGGCYSFWQEYDTTTKVMEYGTSSTFSYCRHNGFFCNNNNCNECSSNEPRIMEISEVMAIISNIKNARHDRYNQPRYNVNEKIENGVWTIWYENRD